jgi:EmrB/QacA subfamily drug resistance transporter
MLPARRPALVLAVVGLSLMAVVSAVSGLNVALPSLARETGASQTDLTWIVDAYTVVFAGLLLFAGALGDRYGRKLLLVIGLLVFGAAAATAMVVSEPWMLIAARAAMGMGAAAIMPTTLSVITTSFPEEQRPRAIGVWVGIAGGGAVLGLFASGLLLEFFAWQSFFGLNVGLAALALAGVLAFVPPSADREPPALDWIGAALSLAAVGGAVFGIIEGPERGWGDPLTLAALAIGLVGGVLFVVWELRRDQPMLDPRLFRLRGLSSGTLTITAQFFSAFGFFFILLQYLQFVTDRSPFEAAVALLPLPFVLIPVARNAPHVAERVGFRWLGAIGLLLIAASFAMLSQLEADTPYWYLALGLVLFGGGMGLAGTPATTAITSALPVSKQGVASAINDTARELGSAFGIAILGSVLNQSYRDAMTDAVAGLPSFVADHVLASIAFTAAPDVQATPAAAPIVAAARSAFVIGVGNAVLLGSVILVVAAVAVFVLAPRSRTEARAAAAAAVSHPLRPRNITPTDELGTGAAGEARNITPTDELGTGAAAPSAGQQPH